LKASATLLSFFGTDRDRYDSFPPPFPPFFFEIPPLFSALVLAERRSRREAPFFFNQPRLLFFLLFFPSTAVFFFLFSLFLLPPTSASKRLFPPSCRRFTSLCRCRPLPFPFPFLFLYDAIEPVEFRFSFPLSLFSPELYLLFFLRARTFFFFFFFSLQPRCQKNISSLFFFPLHRSVPLGRARFPPFSLLSETAVALPPRYPPPSSLRTAGLPFPHHGPSVEVFRSLPLFFLYVSAGSAE